MGSTKSGALLF